ncbi:MAG: hypothetical protein ACLQNE_31240 [Thermoguttaceae bacterium]
MGPTIDKMRNWMRLLGWQAASYHVGGHRFVVAMRAEHRIIARADTIYRAWWAACHQAAKIEREGGAWARAGMVIPMLREYLRCG